MTDNKYISNAQQTLLTVLRSLGHQPLSPQSASDIAEAQKIPKDSVFRALKNLEEAGWAEQLPGGAWRLTPTLTQISERLRLQLAQMHQHYLDLEISDG